MTKTFESLPFLLPNREHWVITRDKGFDAPEGVKIFHSPEAASEAARVLDAAYVIGGAQVYEAFLPYVDTMYITEVDHEFEGDAFFPELTIWQQERQTFKGLTAHNDDMTCRFLFKEFQIIRQVPNQGIIFTDHTIMCYGYD